METSLYRIAREITNERKIQMKMWYEKDLRRILVDMHIPDWDERLLKDFSAERYAAMMKKAHVTVAEIYAGNSLGICFWPTKTGYMHRQLTGRDILGETIAACQKEGIDVQIYFSVWATIPYKTHPEWRMIFEDGKGSCENFVFFGNGRFGICCPNTGFRNYFLEELDELNSRYDACGFWIDNLAWWNSICYCPSCRRLYKDETGEDIPRAVDWNDPHFLRFAEWRERSLANFAQAITDTIKKRTPDRTVTIQSGTMIGGWGSAISENFIKASEYLAGDFTGDRIQQSLVCKFFSAFSAHKPMEFMTPRCESLFDHTTERPFENLLMRSYAALANQASFTLIDAIDPEGTLDERFYEHAQKINDSYARYEAYISGTSVPLADVAIYHSFDSQIDTDIEAPVPIERRKEWGSKHWKELSHMAQAFGEAHLLFTFTGRGQNFSRYPVIVLSDASRLTDAECEALQAYVANGGRLYASYCSSLYNPEKGMRNDFALANLFGVHYKGRTQKMTYIAPEGESLLNGFCTKRYPVTLEGRQLRLSADNGVKIEGTLVLPVSEASENIRFSSGISNPPMLPQGTPALVRHAFGKGEVIYCAGKLEENPFAFQQKIFEKILFELRGKPFIETEAPASTEITVFDQPDENKFVISLLNLPAELPAIPVFGLKVKFLLPEGVRAERLLLLPEETPFPFEKTSDAVEFTLPRLNEFAMFLLEYSK